jgi:hypothetical protein
MRFDIRIETAKGVSWAICMRRKVMETSAMAPVVANKKSIHQAHSLLGHMCEEATRKAAKTLAWTLTAGSLGPCESCAIGKGRQRNLPKDTGGQIATLAASRVYLDCCSFKDSMTMKVASVWRLMVFYPSELKITDIFNSKSAMIEPTIEKLSQMCQLGVGPKILRMDNAGENKSLADRLKSKGWKLPIKVEWTARDTPQQNSPTEVGFATLAGRARAMMAAANIPEI